VNTRTRITAVAIAAMAALGTAGGLAASASASTAGGEPTPSPTITQPVPSPTPPVVGLRNCRFTVTDEWTFVPQLGRFVDVRVPSITCVDRWRRVTVYTLSQQGGDLFGR
jgi:hypothetical protein